MRGSENKYYSTELFSSRTLLHAQNQTDFYAMSSCFGMVGQDLRFRQGVVAPTLKISRMTVAGYCSVSSIPLQTVRGELVEPQMEGVEYIALRLAQQTVNVKKR
jgi:hypothetical protein